MFYTQYLDLDAGKIREISYDIDSNDELIPINGQIFELDNIENKTKYDIIQLFH